MVTQLRYERAKPRNERHRRQREIAVLSDLLVLCRALAYAEVMGNGVLARLWERNPAKPDSSMRAFIGEIEDGYRKFHAVKEEVRQKGSVYSKTLNALLRAGIQDTVSIELIVRGRAPRPPQIGERGIEICKEILQASRRASV